MKKLNIFILILNVIGLPVCAQQNNTVVKGTAIVQGYDNTKLEDKTFTYQPKGNVKDLFLSVENISAKLIIKGSDNSAIDLQAKGLMSLPKKAKGLRAVSKFGEDNTKMEINLTQVGNDIKLIGTNIKRSKMAVYTIIVPKEITLTVVNFGWGAKDLEIKNIKGGVEVIVSSNNVRLDQVTGPLSISSNSGDIEVIYDEISSEALTAFSTSSGDIDITLAAKENVDFNISQSNGEIFTDLDIVFTNEKPKVEKKTVGRFKVYPLAQAAQNQLARAISINSTLVSKASLNSGGIRIDINSIAGDVYLRKK